MSTVEPLYNGHLTHEYARGEPIFSQCDHDIIEIGPEFIEFIEQKGNVLQVV